MIWFRGETQQETCHPGGRAQGRSAMPPYAKACRAFCRLPTHKAVGGTCPATLTRGFHKSGFPRWGPRTTGRPQPVPSFGESQSLSASTGAPAKETREGSSRPPCDNHDSAAHCRRRRALPRSADAPDGFFQRRPMHDPSGGAMQPERCLRAAQFPIAVTWSVASAAAPRDRPSYCFRAAALPRGVFRCSPLELSRTRAGKNTYRRPS